MSDSFQYEDNRNVIVIFLAKGCSACKALQPKINDLTNKLLSIEHFKKFRIATIIYEKMTVDSLPQYSSENIKVPRSVGAIVEGFPSFVLVNGKKWNQDKCLEGIAVFGKKKNSAGLLVPDEKYFGKFSPDIVINWINEQNKNNVDLQSFLENQIETKETNETLERKQNDSENNKNKDKNKNSEICSLKRKYRIV